MATTPELHEPQIAAARAQSWHQASEPSNPLLTMEAARAFVEEHGLVLFAPRALGAPAPSLVEATLGTAKPAATAAEADTARTLVARLVAEGSAVPLNLLGGPGEIPDFIVSTAAFPFVFTLRGDKGWKRPPETSGAVKVAPLALRVFELLTERGAMTVADIVSEAGREVTHSAISRALSELWSLLRVLPALQGGAGETLWELTTTRFLKAVKAGANAGQPTALSALISLYLGQVYTATGEEIETFLSPLTARSRIRDVLHGLTAGRQLSEGVIAGKTVLYIPETLPDFAQFAPAADGAATLEASPVATPDGPMEQGIEPSADQPAGDGRIRRFDAGADGGSRKTLRGKPIPREGGARSGPRPGTRTGPRPATPGGSRGGEDRPRPFVRKPSSAEGGGSRSGYKGGSERPSFTRPWDEDRASRPPREGGENRPAAGADRPARSPRSGDDSRPPRREGGEGRPFRPARPREEGRPPFRREGGSDRSPFRREGGSDRPPFRREGGSDRPPFRREGGSDRPPFRREGGSDRPPFRREGGSDRPPFRREGGGDRPPFRREGGSDRPPFRREGGSARPPFRREGGSDRPRSSRPSSDRPLADRPYSPRPYARREGSPSDRPAPRREGDRPDRGSGFDRPRPSGPRPGGGFSRGPARGPSQSFSRGPGGPGGRPPFRGATGEGRPAGDRPFRGADGPRRGLGGPGGPRGPRPGGPGGFSRGAFSNGPKGLGRGGPARGDARGPARGRPSPGKRPEDEA